MHKDNEKKQFEVRSTLQIFGVKKYIIVENLISDLQNFCFERKEGYNIGENVLCDFPMFFERVLKICSDTTKKLAILKILYNRSLTSNWNLSKAQDILFEYIEYLETPAITTQETPSIVVVAKSEDNHTPTQEVPTSTQITPEIEKEKQAKKDALKAFQCVLPEKKDYLDYFNKINIEDEFIIDTTVTIALAGEVRYVQSSIAGVFWQHLKNFKDTMYLLPDKAKIFLTKKQLAISEDFLDKTSIPIKRSGENSFLHTKIAVSTKIEYRDFLKVYLEFLDNNQTPAITTQETPIVVVAKSEDNLTPTQELPTNTQKTPSKDISKNKSNKTDVRNAIVAYYLIRANLLVNNPLAIETRFNAGTKNNYKKYSENRLKKYLKITVSVCERELKEYPKALAIALKDIKNPRIKYLD